ncbi:BolA protein [Noviherbaspirillum humi]|uniref:BolA protein n=1 Tax=Noviherbaspirillum humi TaxID=1688639 RepID=A0A239G336_9BURK|nr:BolA family protein [Noviherbaspirillum humi]SNS63118.1 BolA protein [Noviherbaspirillum humi]
MSDRMERIRARLEQAFAPSRCELVDDSHLHAGHAGAAGGAGHYRVTLVSAAFEGRNRVSRHRLVYDCLRDMMQAEIHALVINAIAPSELASQPSAPTA